MTIVINDVDSHEMIPGHLLGDFFGEEGRMMGRLLEAADRHQHDPTDTNMHHPGVFDTMAINDESVWQVRGPMAPSAIDFGRRLEVMDVMGIDRQLVFPTTAIAAVMVAGMTDMAFERRFGPDTSMLGDLSRPEFGERYIHAYNQWALDNAVLGDGRIRMVGIVPTTPDVNEMIAQAHKLVDGGVRAVYLMADQPPGGVSPANVAFDPMWELFEANDIAVTLHLGVEFFFVDPRWALADAFQDLFQSPEIPNTNIQMYAGVHMALDNYLSTLVLGGVFERFPRLRVGLLEVGAHWIGPSARRWDMYVNVFRGSAAAKLPMKPSEYVNRNVRVSPFNFESVDRYFQDDPNLADVYCYSTDYPHVEGLKDSKNMMLKRVEPLGEEYVKKFFQTNGEWLLP